MGQRRRHDGVGVWHHVCNRGIAKRSVFEGPLDERYFLSRLARVHRLGLLEIYAYCLMITHFHLLVRSPVGKLSEALRMVLNPYVRWFNRSRRRDGPLFRGRFLSRPVRSEADRCTVFRYTHLNPVKAGIVDLAEAYLHSSARHLTTAGPRPRWLLRDAIGGGSSSSHSEGPAVVSSVLETPLTDVEQEFVERRLAAPGSDEDPLDMLLGGAPSQVRGWLRMKADLADNTRPGLPVVTPDVLLSVLAEQEAGRPDHTVQPGRKAVSAWSLLRAGLLRQACGMTFSEIALHAGISTSQAHVHCDLHRRQLLADEAYASISCDALRQAVGALRLHESSLQAGG